jgi:hypothetical protein
MTGLNVTDRNVLDHPEGRAGSRCCLGRPTHDEALVGVTGEQAVEVPEREPVVVRAVESPDEREEVERAVICKGDP